MKSDKNNFYRTKISSVIERHYIICGTCNYRFDRASEFKHCSNCFACTGCEIYYCPGCENEIIIKAVKQPAKNPDSES